MTSTAVDNIFVLSTRFSWSTTPLIINNLSDHDAQYFMINNIDAPDNLIPLKQRIKINK
jgi:hypothetical protein